MFYVFVLPVTGQDNGSGTNTTPRRGRENFNRQGIARGSTRPESFFAPVGKDLIILL